MNNVWVFLCAVFVWYPVRGTYHASSCVCNGKALYCVRDVLGLRCVSCRENTDGRHCESCKEGYYHQRAGEGCLPCYCSTLGSVGSGCDSQGQCLCKPGVQGARCDHCANGSPITANGCEPLQQKTCFCSGHSNECSPAQGYSIYNITSAFDQGTEGWKSVLAKDVSPLQVQFRWSPTRHDLEVISKDLLPVYLSAPARYLGNQALSYGQTLSFSLRLGRGVRHPSTSDVVLEGAGLKVSTSLGNLRNIIPCGKTITYTFRLDEQPGSKWKPQLSTTEFQTLLSNLTAIKIRATFGQDGHGYLDSVTLVSARLGPGVPANWVQNCHCPAGYEGQFCEFCATGYKRRYSERGVPSHCEPCDCRGGSCDPETGDCYSADETSNGQVCPTGYYSDPSKPSACQKCPCSLGYDCSLTPGALQVTCNCPLGSKGFRCQKCSDGFYGDPLGENGIQRPCEPCRCNGHLDVNALGSCDPVTGECLKCLNNTTGFNCEKCLEGFYHSKPTDACQACKCNPKSSVSMSCSDKGQCECKKDFEGKRCERSACPSCFNPVKSQVGKYVKKLQELETLFGAVGSGDVSNAMEKAISAAEEMVESIENKADTLIDERQRLHDQLLSIDSSQLREEKKMHDVSKIVDEAVQKDRQLQREVADIQKLISIITQNLLKARTDINKADLPVGDAVVGINSMSEWVQQASDLANQHTGLAATVEQTAKGSLLEAEKALALMNSVISGENKVKGQVNDLKSQYDKNIALVDAIHKQANRLSDSAKAESMEAVNMINQISDLERNLPNAPKKDIDSLVARLDGLKDLLASNVTRFEQLQSQTLADKKEAEDLMNQLKNAQKAQDKLLDRANAAKADADQALKLFNNLGNVDQTLERLRGFEDQISTSKALADDALSKLPIIGATIQNAVTSNDKTQAILDNLGDYKDTLDTLDKVNISLAKIEKMSGSLPSSSDLLETATTLKGGLEGLKNQANLALNKLTKEKQNAEKERLLAEQVNRDAGEANKNALNTRAVIGDTIKTVNDLLGLLGTPGTVDEKKVADLESAIANSRGRVEAELKPRLRELENREIQQKAAITRMINDIETILVDIENLKKIRQTIPDGCYSTPPIERP